MRVAELRVFCRLLSSGKADLLPGSRLGKQVGAGHSPPGQACLSTSLETLCSNSSPTRSCFQSSQRSPPLCSSAGTVGLGPSHGTTSAQHRSFASSGGSDNDSPGDGEASSASPPSNSVGSSQDSLESDQHSQQSAPGDGSSPYMNSPDTDMAEGQLASLAADAVSQEEPWALTDEQRQAERELRAPPSGEPLYPDRRGGLAWEPFSDDEMDLTVSPHCLASGTLAARDCFTAFHVQTGKAGWHGSLS